MHFTEMVDNVCTHVTPTIYVMSLYCFNKHLIEQNTWPGCWKYPNEFIFNNIPTTSVTNINKKKWEFL